MSDGNHSEGEQHRQDPKPQPVHPEDGTNPQKADTEPARAEGEHKEEDRRKFPESSLDLLKTFSLRSTIISLSLVLAALLLVFDGFVTNYVVSFNKSGSIGSSDGSAAVEPPQTEVVFVERAEQEDKVGSEVHTEWRAAREEHKLIAFAIVQCQKMRELIPSIDTMNREVFSALLLDLMPSGGHRFPKSPQNQQQVQDTNLDLTKSGQTSPHPATYTEKSNPEHVAVGKTNLPFDNYDSNMLALSDEIGRARLAAISGASTLDRDKSVFGWITVLIGAAATVFVTIKSVMSAPSGSWMKALYQVVGLAAILLSAAVTALTAVKQFYDPIRGYKANELALLDLRRLHTEVALTFLRDWDRTKCAPRDAASDVISTRWDGWSINIAALQGALVAASPSLQDSDISQRNGTSGIGGNLPRPSGAGNPPPTPGNGNASKSLRVENAPTPPSDGNPAATSGGNPEAVTSAGDSPQPPGTGKPSVGAPSQRGNASGNIPLAKH
jgi:hypothetical protein